MRRYQFSSLLLSGALTAMMILTWPASVRAQDQTPAQAPATPSETEKFDVAFTYNPMFTGLITSNNTFWMEGGTAQAQFKLDRNWGEVVEVSGLHTGNMSSSGVGLNLINFLVGPRYTWLPRQAHKYKYQFFAQGLVGGSHGSNSIFPALPTYNTSASGFSTQVGGGVNFKLSPRVWLRLPEIDWLYTTLPNGANNEQNSLKLGFGVMVQFK
jgi:hypothetical protein